MRLHVLHPAAVLATAGRDAGQPGRGALTLAGCVGHRPPQAEVPKDADAALDAEVGELYQAGRLTDATARLRAAVAADPKADGFRFELAEMLLIVEDLDGATEQINTMIATNANFADGGKVLLGFIDAERARREYLAGAMEPEVPNIEPWLSTYKKAPQGLAADSTREATIAAVRAARASIPRRAGTVDGTPFAFVCDADDVLAPGIEFLVPQGYAVVPFHALRRIDLGNVTAFVDVVWRPVRLTLLNGDVVDGRVPTLYAGSNRMGDVFSSGQSTASVGLPSGLMRGIGQRDLRFEDAAGNVRLIGIRDVNAIVFDGP